MNTRLLLFAVLLVVLLLGASALWWAIVPDPLESLVKEVRVGMVEAEVEAILSKPDFTSTFKDGVTMHKWVTDRVIVMVDFDPTGRVQSTLLHRRPLWDRIQELRK